MRCPACGGYMTEWPELALLACDNCEHVEPLPLHVVLEREGHPRLPGMPP